MWAFPASTAPELRQLEGNALDDSQRSAYDRLAPIYDTYLAQFDRMMLPALEHLMLSRLAPNACILDVCCGTGQLAAELCGRGYRVTGVDSSEGMLRFARENAPAGRFVRADVRSLRLSCVHDAAVSTFDSINHILSIEDLCAVFANVAAALRAGGVFVFDVMTEAGYRMRWKSSCRMIGGDGELCEIKDAWDDKAKVARHRITFRRSLDGQSIDEFDIFERCYSEEEVRSALSDAGFADISSYEAQRDLGVFGEQGRSVFVAEK